MSIAIVTDTACNITPEMGEEMGVYLLPIEITIEGESFEDGFDITTEEFYDKMIKTGAVPTTSQPAPSKAYGLYKKLSEEYDEILSIHLGSNVSGTIQTLELIAQEVETAKVTVFDSQLVSVPAGYLVKEAKRLVNEGKQVSEIVEQLNKLRDQSVAFASVHTMDNLVKSGRVPSIMGTVAKIAKIKPILTIKASEEKGLEVAEKVRTSKRANSKLIEMVFEYTETLDYPFHLDIAHGKAPDMAEELKTNLEENFPQHDIQTHLLTSVIGAHSGPDIVGVFIAPNLDEMTQ